MAREGSRYLVDINSTAFATLTDRAAGFEYLPRKINIALSIIPMSNRAGHSTSQLPITIKHPWCIHTAHSIRYVSRRILRSEECQYIVRGLRIDEPTTGITPCMCSYVLGTEGIKRDDMIKIVLGIGIWCIAL